MVLRAEIPGVRRRALIGATLQEIAQTGSLEVTMARIARRAGVSPALAHHYFGGKDDLILATMRYLLAEFRIEVVAGLRAARTPRARLSAVIASSFGPDQFHHATISAWLTFYAWALSSPEAARLLTVYQRRLDSNLVDALGALVSRAEARRIAASLGAHIDGVYLREALNRRPSDPAAGIARIERLLDLELAGRPS